MNKDESALTSHVQKDAFRTNNAEEKFDDCTQTMVGHALTGRTDRARALPQHKSG